MFLEEFWRSFRRENTPEIDGKPMEVDENAKDSNERLVQLYKDTIEKKSKSTRVQSSFDKIAKQSHKNADVKTKFVPLKVNSNAFDNLIINLGYSCRQKKRERASCHRRRFR